MEGRGISCNHGLFGKVAEYTRISMEYQGISWNSVEHHVIMGCLGRSNIMEYQGTSWNSMEYHDIMVCLGSSLSVLDYDRKSRKIMEWR